MLTLKLLVMFICARMHANLFAKIIDCRNRLPSMLRPQLPENTPSCPVREMTLDLGATGTRLCCSVLLTTTALGFAENSCGCFCCLNCALCLA